MVLYIKFETEKHDLLLCGASTMTGCADVNKHHLIKNWCVVYVLRQLNMDRRMSSCSALGGKSSDVTIQQTQ